MYKGIGISWFSSWLNWNLDCLVFLRMESWRIQRKTPRSNARTNNKLNPYIAPGQNWTRVKLGRRALSPRLHHPCSPICLIFCLVFQPMTLLKMVAKSGATPAIMPLQPCYRYFLCHLHWINLITILNCLVSSFSHWQ